MCDRHTAAPPELPLVGHTLHYARGPLAFFESCHRRFGDIVPVRLVGRTCYLLFHPALVEDVLRENPSAFMKDRLTRTALRELGHGLLTSDGDHWRRHRRLARPAFQPAAVQQYLPGMIALTEQMVERWQEGAEVDLHAEWMRLALAIVARTLFGADLSHDMDLIGRTMDVMMRYLSNPLTWTPVGRRLPSLSGCRYRRYGARLERIIDRMIAERSGGGGDDLLARYMRARDAEGGRMTERRLRDEMRTLLPAGHETTAIVLTFCVFLLGRHPGVEARLREELNGVLAGRAPAPEDLPRLTYTEQVVREALRLYPPAWCLGREAVTHCEVGGVPIAPGEQVVPVQWVIHRDPRWFEQPEQFRPERWSEGLAKQLPRGSYFPFGDGPRVCIGSHFAMLEAVVILATVLQRHRLEVSPDQPMRLLPSISLRPRNGLRVRLRRLPGVRLRPVQSHELPAR